MQRHGDRVVVHATNPLTLYSPCYLFTYTYDKHIVRDSLDDIDFHCFCCVYLGPLIWTLYIITFGTVQHNNGYHLNLNQHFIYALVYRYKIHAMVAIKWQIAELWTGWTLLILPRCPIFRVHFIIHGALGCTDEGPNMKLQTAVISVSGDGVWLQVSLYVSGCCVLVN